MTRKKGLMEANDVLGIALYHIIIFFFFCIKSFASESYTVSFNKLENNISLNNQKNISTSSDTLKFKYTKSFDPRNKFSVSMLYAESRGNEITNASVGRENFISRGVQEPKFTYIYSAKIEQKHDGEALQFKVSLIPSLYKKRSGGTNSNQAIGGHVMTYEAFWGKSYSQWAGYINFVGSQNFAAFEKNMVSETEYSKSGYSSFALDFIGKYKFDSRWSFFISTGLEFVSSIGIETDKTQSRATIQQGTGTTKNIGVHYHTSKRTYSFVIKASRNQFFINEADGLADADYNGGFERYSFNLSVSYF